MALIIENCKGHVHVVTAGSSGGSSGFYSVDPPIPDAEGSKVILQGIPLNFREIVQPTVTLDDKRTLYVFGTAWNEASLTGMLLLGDSSTRGKQVETLIDWYDQNRVSKKKGPVSLSLGTVGVSAYVVGLRLEAADPVFNKQGFSVILLMSEIKSEG